MRVEIALLVGVLGIHHARGHGQMYNPTPWQATSDCSSPNPGDCHWDLKVDTSCTGNCHGAVAEGKITIGETAFSTNYTMAPGLEPTLPEEMFDDWLPEWRRVTWTGRGEFGLNPWNAPGSAPVYGNGCGVNGGNPDGCTGGDPSCSTKKYDNMELMGHTTIGYNDKSFEDCLTLCCENSMCKSFDHGDHSGYNCAVITKTKDEVSLVPGTKQWSHYAVFKTSGEDLGQCCGKPGTGDCGGYSGGKSALEHYKDGIFGEPKVTTWTRGEAAEVYWTSNGYHRGGYAYRLCRVPDGQYWKVTEECFQQGHLNFSGKTSWLSWKPWVSRPKYFEWAWIPMDLITTTTGTTPEGSEWAKINIPKEASTGDWWAFKDLVEVPTSLTPGDYVLSFRWDCLESPQIWSACANIKIE